MTGFLHHATQRHLTPSISRLRQSACRAYQANQLVPKRVRFEGESSGEDGVIKIVPKQSD